MYEVKAIETEYNGYLFRSRTEARWAVFFDYVGEPYEYEKECFQLPSGKYLPDFFLPKKNLWVEIKGKEPTENEWRKCCELGLTTGEMVACISGTPGRERGLVMASVPAVHKIACWDDAFFTITKGDLGFNVGKCVTGNREEATQVIDFRHILFSSQGMFLIGQELDTTISDIELYNEAVAYSRKARFEKGVKKPRGE